MDQIAEAVHMAGAQDEVGSGDIAAAVGAVVAAAPLGIVDSALDIRWGEADCIGFADPYGVALQDPGQRADRREHEGAYHSR